jgi:hypothetical protein
VHLIKAVANTGLRGISEMPDGDILLSFGNTPASIKQQAGSFQRTCQVLDSRWRQPAIGSFKF